MNSIGAVNKRGKMHVSINQQSSKTIKLDVSQLDFRLLNNAAAYKVFMRNLSFRVVFIHQKSITLPPKTTETFQAGPSYFKMIEELVSAINGLKGFSSLAQFGIRHGKVILTTKANLEPCNIELGGLENHFGFDQRFYECLNQAKKLNFSPINPKTYIEEQTISTYAVL